MIFNEGNFPDLPNSWAPLHVEEAYENIAVKEKTQVKKYLSSGQLPVIDQGANLIGGYVNDLEKSVTSDLPVIIFGDHTRAIKYIDFLFAAGADGIKVLKPKGFFEPKLFYHFLRTIRLPDKGYARHFQYLRSSKIALPPLPEQKRIADKLDTLLARVDSCQSHLERVPQIIKRFRQSVLAAATSGRLTKEWREENGEVRPWLSTIPDGGVPLPKNDYKRLGKVAFKLTKIEHTAKELPETWALLSIADLYNMKVLVDFADGNHGAMYPRKEDFTGEGALFLTATQIGETWEVDIQACPRLRSDKAQQLVKGWAKKNDVLLTHNATVGRVALLEYGEEDVLLGTSVTFYRFNDKFISPNYGRILFSSPFFQDQLKMEMVQTTRNQVPITKQVSFNFICPPLEEQAEIVRRVERLFAFAERLEARWRAGQNLVEQLTPSLLAKAFRGELVEQDTEDEPAAVLLERIKAERSVLKKLQNGIS